ncbi:MAG: Malate/L-lactate dehydrogenase [Proteobacteria bacterium]|nr:Malate/L-lactate dehydrogenase [Pseudomonadota bacterium]
MTSKFYPVESLIHLAEELFIAAGMEDEKAMCVARLLVTGDMLGQRTHGIALCPQYIEQIDKGLMSPRGEPEVVRDSGAVIVWDGNYLPGPWLVSHALEVAAERVAAQGVVTCVIRRSHHIACLTSLIKQATDKGLIAILASSDPAFGFIAPYGGKEPLLTPNPIAMGYPDSRAPVWIDASTSITTVGMARQKSAADTPFAHPWLMDVDGNPTTDPHVLDPGARGTLLLVGGREYGHKGFGLSLIVEVLTQGLAGFGRQDSEARWGANIFLQVLDPAAFAGREAFLRQMDYLTDRCHANAPIDPQHPVRMPGEMEQRRIQAANESGVELSPAAQEALRATCARFGVAMPAAHPASKA